MAEISPALAAIFGAFVTGLTSLAIVFVNRRFDDRRHWRGVSIKAALNSRINKISRTVADATRPK